jgi:hypothetical protein
MKAWVMDEPEVEFAGGCRHIDPRFGIADYGPVDLGTPRAPSEIRVGVIGPASGVDGARQWLERCRDSIAAKPTDKSPRLFRDFPGFDTNVTFRSRLIFDDTLTRTIPNRALTSAFHVFTPSGLGVSTKVAIL